MVRCVMLSKVVINSFHSSIVDANWADCFFSQCVLLIKISEYKAETALLGRTGKITWVGLFFNVQTIQFVKMPVEMAMRIDAEWINALIATMSLFLGVTAKTQDIQEDRYTDRPCCGHRRSIVRYDTEY